MTLTDQDRALLAQLPLLKKILPRDPRTLAGVELERKIRAYAASREAAIGGMTLRGASTRAQRRR